MLFRLLLSLVTNYSNLVIMFIELYFACVMYFTYPYAFNNTSTKSVSLFIFPFLASTGVFKISLPSIPQNSIDQPQR